MFSQFVTPSAKVTSVKLTVDVIIMTTELESSSSKTVASSKVYKPSVPTVKVGTTPTNLELYTKVEL